MTTATDTAPAPQLSDIRSAAQRLHGVVHRTPLEHSAWLSSVAGVPVFLKLECFQRTRSFKLRGAYNAIAALPPDILARGLVTASAGNHGQAVALSATLLGARATVLVPGTTPDIKKQRIRFFGATLDDSPADYDSAETAAAERSRATGEFFVHAFSDPAVVAGQGTIGLEIAEDLRDVAHVITPVGGGGLGAGIGTALKGIAPQAKLWGVQSSETRAMYDAFLAGAIVASPITPTIAEGLAGCTDATAYARLRTVLDDVTLVPESLLEAVMRETFELTGIVIEGSAAVGIAAVLHGIIRPDGPTVIVVSGGNVDPDRLQRLLQRS